MNYKDILGEEITNSYDIRFSNLDEYHYYIPKILDDNDNYIINNKIYLDGNFTVLIN